MRQAGSYPSQVHILLRLRLPSKIGRNPSKNETVFTTVFTPPNENSMLFHKPSSLQLFDVKLPTVETSLNAMCVAQVCVLRSLRNAMALRMALRMDSLNFLFAMWYALNEGGRLMKEVG